MTPEDDNLPSGQHALEAAWRNIVQLVFREIGKVAKTPAEESLLLARVTARLAESMAMERQAPVTMAELMTRRL